jgi:hypothetical protein
MENEDKKEFAKLLWMFANDAGVKISQEQLSVKFEMLKEFSIEDITKASHHLAKYRETTWPAIPAIPEFVKIIESFGLKAVGIEERAEMQAAIVIKKLKYDGRNGVIDFSDPITKSIMTDRWPYNSWASTITESDITWWKKDFIVLYKSYGKYENAGLLTETPGGKMIPTDGLKQLANNAIKRIE